MRLCLNMIVRNESAIIERCLRSVIPYISCWAITDTGSTDETLALARDVLDGFPGKPTSRLFTNFAESRNAALDDAKSLDFDYYLFMDADQELVASDPEWHRDLSHDAYLLLQKSDDYSYRNIRLLRKDVKAHYVGSTHEQLLVEGDIWAIDEASIIDHADGSNRAGKLELDKALLERELRRSPTDPRTIYYLAQTHRDLGNYKIAAHLYRQRSGLDNSEEAWRSHLEYSRCLLSSGKDSKFVHESLVAYAKRPTRAEPLNDLARFFIDEGQHAAALEFTEIGMRLPKPQQELGVVDDGIYDYGLRECYYVTTKDYPDARLVCDELSLDREAPQLVRQRARNNIYHYCKPIEHSLLSWKTKRLSFEPPAGYNQMNCSIARFGDKLLLMERTITYTVDGNGGYHPVDNEHSRNFLLDIDPETLNDVLMYEVLPPTNFPSPVNNSVYGWEDLRLISCNGNLWVIGCVCEQNRDGMAEQYLARVTAIGQLEDWCRLTPIAKPRRHEKNWMPLANSKIDFVYSCDPTVILNSYGKTVRETTPPIAADHFRGGSQLIPYEGGYLALIHSTAHINNMSWYYHRFVTFNSQLYLDGVSIPFIFTPGDESKRAYQYAMGLCWHPDAKRLIVSYQTDECRSWLGTFDKGDLPNIMRNV